MDILEHSRIVGELSDRIAELNRQILQKAKMGEPVDPNDRLLLDKLTRQLEATSIDDDNDDEPAASG